VRSISRLKNELRRTKNANKITTNKREVKKARETTIEAKTTRRSTKIDVEANAIIATTTTTITTNKKRSLRLCKQFVYIYISFALKTTSILLSYLLLFNNL